MREDEAGGGDVDEGHLTSTQQHLQQWGEQDWRTVSGDADGTARYLPDVAWQRATDRRTHDADAQHVANTDAAKQAREAAELLTMTAPEAQRRVRAMTTRSALEKARAAEQEHGTGRTTVLRVVEQRLRALE